MSQRLQSWIRQRPTLAIVLVVAVVVLASQGLTLWVVGTMAESTRSVELMNGRVRFEMNWDWGISKSTQGCSNQFEATMSENSASRSLATVQVQCISGRSDESFLDETDAILQSVTGRKGGLIADDWSAKNLRHVMSRIQDSRGNPLLRLDQFAFLNGLLVHVKAVAPITEPARQEYWDRFMKGCNRMNATLQIDGINVAMKD